MNTADYKLNQLCTQSLDFPLAVASYAPGFVQDLNTAPIVQHFIQQTGTKDKPRLTERVRLIYSGELSAELTAEFERSFKHCPHCQELMHRHSSITTDLKHLPFGGSYTALRVTRLRRCCPNCGHTVLQPIPFKEPGHLITTAAAAMCCLTMKRTHTVKGTALSLGLSRNVVKECHKAYLKELYADPETGRLKKPEKFSPHLGIDEWKLHDGNVMATIILDLDDGRILWVQESKSKEVVYQFMDYAGEEFMQHVETLACDMNADFAAAFKSRYPHIEVVYDRFHLMKNLNEKVAAPIRIAEEKRLKAEGRTEEAARLKHCKYLLTSLRSTLQAKDEQGTAAMQQAAQASSAGSGREAPLFAPLLRPKAPYNNRLETYESLLKENELFFALDLVKEQLTAAYQQRTAEGMRTILDNVVKVCLDTGSARFKWFARLITRHIDGIAAYAKHRITSGKCEGTVNLIKTIRRACYGFQDNDYFFLRLIDASNGYR